MPLRPQQTFNLIVIASGLALLAETALLWKLSQNQNSSARAPVPSQLAPTETFAPSAAEKSVFIAPGAVPQQPATSQPSIPQPTASSPSPTAEVFIAPPKIVAGAPVFAGKNTPVAGNRNPDAKAYFEAATAALAKKDDAGALENFRHVARLAPNNLPTRLNLALLYLSGNRPAEAIPHLQKAALLDRRAAAPRFQLAQAFLALKKPALAIAPLQEVVKLAPKERAARALLAQVYLAQKRPREAYEQWQSLAQSEPRDVEAHLQAATLAADALRRPAEAEKWLRRAQSAVPKDPRAALLLGRLFLAQNQPKRAVQALEGALKTRPDVFDIYPALANARLAAGDLRGARGALQGALSRIPAANDGAQKAQAALIEGGLRLALGRVLGQSKKPQDARKEFQCAAALLPRDAEPRSLLALAALQSGDKKAAIGALEAALRIDPKRAGDRLTLAQISAQSQNWREADIQFAAYSKLQPRDKGALIQWAQVAARRKNGEQGLQIWSKVAAIDPKDPVPHLQSGAILRDAKRPARALSEFERALQVSPTNPSALFEVARLQSALKKPDAAQSWQKLIAVQPNYLPAYPALLDASAQSGTESGARIFLARQLGSGPENPRALSEILRFYAQKGRASQAKALLGDIVQRNPKAKTARAALDSFGDSKPAPPPAATTKTNEAQTPKTGVPAASTPAAP